MCVCGGGGGGVDLDWVSSGHTSPYCRFRFKKAQNDNFELGFTDQIHNVYEKDLLHSIFKSASAVLLIYK